MGVPQIEVTFDIDANGIVNVSAKDKASGKEQTIRIQASGGLTEADIQRMVKEAEAHAEEDKRRRELVEARNQADAAIYTVEKSLKDAEGRVPPNVKSEVEQAVSQLKDAMKGEDVQRIKQGTERVSQAAIRARRGHATAPRQRPAAAPALALKGSRTSSMPNSRRSTSATAKRADAVCGSSQRVMVTPGAEPCRSKSIRIALRPWSSRRRAWRCAMATSKSRRCTCLRRCSTTRIGWQRT